MPFKPSANLVYLLSGVLLLAALVVYFLGVFDLVERAFDLAFWIAIIGWITAGMIILQE